VSQCNHPHALTQIRDERITMMKLMISSAALIAAAAFVTVPASADYIGGSPRVNAQGKCWLDTGGLRDARYGVWQECPKKPAKASAGTADSSDCGLGQLAWEKQHIGLGFFDYCRK
jgi:hypothetical protein